MIKIKECCITLFAAFGLLFSCLNISAQVPKKIKTIIVDAGHGGSDIGAHGEYEGTLGKDNILVGTFKQGGQSFPMNL